MWRVLTEAVDTTRNMDLTCCKKEWRQMKAWPWLCPQCSKGKQLQRISFPQGFLELKAGSSTMPKLIISIPAGRGGGVSKSVPILALFSHLSQPRLSPCALSMPLRYVPSCCSNRQHFGPGIQKEILLRTLWEPSRGSATPGKQKHTRSHVLLGG